MKTDRLYAITIYLLNHGRTSANELAKYFEVCVRTIQRDIDTLCLAGIPIIAHSGLSGGYELTDTFRMDRQIATQEDYLHIITALRGLATATNNTHINATLEKITSLTKTDSSNMILDFSILREGDAKLLQMLEAAVASKRVVSFTYTNAGNKTRTHTVEPIAVLYRWYAWYLLAYSSIKKDYRTYKLIRMSDLKITDAIFTQEHESADKILYNADKTNKQTSTNITVRCKAEVKIQVMEYLKGELLEELDTGDVMMNLSVMESELFWFGALLSLGDKIEILEPDRIRLKVLEAAKKVVSLYERQ
jgi:predicted DNA-binding transcriptional regulator YafY